MIVSPSSTAPFLLTAVPGLSFELAFNLCGIGFGKRCLSRSGVPLLQPCSAGHCLTLQEDCKYLYELRPLRPCWTIVRALSIRKSRHACDQAGSETGPVPQDHYHFGGPGSWFCRRSESLTNLRTPLTLNQPTSTDRSHGICQEMAVPVGLRSARVFALRASGDWMGIA